MTKRTLIISAYGQGDTSCFENETLLRLVNRWEDELKPWEKVLWEDEGQVGQDLWTAEYDTETGVLSTSMGGGGSEARVSIGGPCSDPILYLLPALLALAND